MIRYRRRRIVYTPEAQQRAESTVRECIADLRARGVNPTVAQVIAEWHEWGCPYPPLYARSIVRSQLVRMAA